MRLKLLILTLFISVANIFAQDVEFQAVSTKKTVGKFEKFRIDFTINQKAGDITPPDFSEFAFLGGPSTSVNQSWVNGRSSFNKTYTYYLMPKGVGKYTIGPAKIKVDGMTYRTRPISITVVEQKKRSSNPNDPETLASNNIKLKMQLSTAEPYVNQQVTVAYYLYFKVNISSPQVIEMPKFNGFWSQDFEKPKRYSIEKDYLDDELYQKILLKKTVLIPQKSGKLVIDPFTIQVPMEISTGRLDFFGNPMSRQYSYTTSTGKRIINVRALPSKGKPKNFTGAVGKFSFEVTSSKTTVEANESITLKAEVKGTGNLKLFSIPELTVPEELEAYDPKHIEKIKLGSKGMTGKVTEEYIIIPRYKGQYKIPSLEFSYFDTSTKKYVILKGEEFNIDVVKGQKKNSSRASGSTKSIAKSGVQMLGKDIRYIHSKTTFETSTNNNFFGSFLYYILLVIPFLTIPMILFIYNQKIKSDSDVVGTRKKKASKIAKKMLSGAGNALKNNDDSKFYEAVIQAMYKYLSYSLTLEQSELNKEIIKEKLELKGASETQISELMNLLNDCEMARYAPSAISSNKQELYNKASDLISELEKI